MDEKHAGAEGIRVVKSAKCPSVSHKSTLGYDVGMDSEGQVNFRVTSNSAPGAFARTWVAWRDIQKTIEVPGREKAITSAHLARLCGGGQNTSGFLLAVLKHEGLLKPSTAKRRCHELVDDAAFLTSIRVRDQTGRGPVSDAGAKPQAKAGPSSDQATKGESPVVMEHASPDTPTNVPSIVTKNDPRTDPKVQPLSVTTTKSSATTKDGAGKVKTKRP